MSKWIKAEEPNPLRQFLGEPFTITFTFSFFPADLELEDLEDADKPDVLLEAERQLLSADWAGIGSASGIPKPDGVELHNVESDSVTYQATWKNLSKEQLKFFMGMDVAAINNQGEETIL